MPLRDATIEKGRSLHLPGEHEAVLGVLRHGVVVLSLQRLRQASSFAALDEFEQRTSAANGRVKRKGTHIGSEDGIIEAAKLHEAAFSVLGQFRERGLPDDGQLYGQTVVRVNSDGPGTLSRE